LFSKLSIQRIRKQIQWNYFELYFTLHIFPRPPTIDEAFDWFYNYKSEHAQRQTRWKYSNSNIALQIHFRLKLMKPLILYRPLEIKCIFKYSIGQILYTKRFKIKMFNNNTTVTRLFLIFIITIYSCRYIIRIFNLINLWFYK